MISGDAGGLFTSNVQAGEWAATGGGESPTALFKQRVNKLANSFTKITHSLSCFSMVKCRRWNSCRLQLVKQFYPFQTAYFIDLKGHTCAKEIFLAPEMEAGFPLLSVQT